MPIHRRILLALATCCAVLAVAGASVAATELLLSSPGRQRLVSSGTISFTSSIVTVRCNVTLEGSFNSAIAQTTGAQVASITSGTASGCSGGERPSVTFQSLPWTMRYRSVGGSQPEALREVVTILPGAAASVTSSGLTCYFRGELGMSVGLSGSNPYPVGSVSTLTNSLPLERGLFCPRSGSMDGSFRFSATEFVGEVPPDPMIPNRPWVTALEATPRAEIFFFNVGMGNQVVEAVNVRPAEVMGWGISIGGVGGCATPTTRWTEPGRSCRIEVQAGRNPSLAQVVLYKDVFFREEVGHLFLVP